MKREDYIDFIQTAREMIDEFGRDIQLIELSNVPKDTEKPWKGPGVPTSANQMDIVGCFVPPSGNNFGKNWVSEELLSRAEQICMTATIPNIDLKKFHLIKDDDNTFWNIKWGQELRPGPLSILYIFGVSR
jgi:hypothetical protein